MKKTKKKVTKGACAFLADISGSTGEKYNDIIEDIKDMTWIMGEIFDKARYKFELAAFMSEPDIKVGLKGVRVVYGDVVYMIKTYDEPYELDQKLRVGSLEAGGGTGMVDASTYLVDRLREVKGDPKIFMLLTDAGADDMSRMKEVFEELEKPGSDIIPLLLVAGGQYSEMYAKELTSNYIVADTKNMDKLREDTIEFFLNYGLFN